MLKLYYSPGSCALASHIALEEAGASYTAERVNFKASQQTSAEYLATTPKGRVPALVTERGVITETPAILAFVAQSFPAAQLAPLDDPFGFARAQAFNSYLCATVHVAHAHRMRGYRWVDDAAAEAAMKKKVPHNIGEQFHLIQSDMLQGPWVLGDRFSVCDAYLYTLSQWLDGDGVDIATLPKIADHFRRTAERPAVQRALAAQRG